MIGEGNSGQYEDRFHPGLSSTNVSRPESNIAFDVECADITEGSKFVKNSRKTGINQTKSFIIGNTPSATNSGRPMEDSVKRGGIKDK